MNFGFLIDNRKCIGCHACTVACKSEHDVPLGVYRTWVKYVETGQFPDNRRHFTVLRCNHCDDAPCIPSCPVTALYRREQDGIVDFDPERCIGCKMCLQACPYDALHIDPDTHTAAKCNFCAHRVEVGLEPSCQVVCPTQAIVSGDLDDPTSYISKLISREPVQVRKPEKGTVPKLFYIDADESSLTPSAATPVKDYGMWNEMPNANGNGQNPSMLQDSEYLLQDLVAKSAKTVYDVEHPSPWGWKVSAYIWTKSIAAGAFLLPAAGLALGLVADNPLLAWGGPILALIFLAITAGLLVWDLKRPDRFYTILIRPQWRSWVAIGTFILLFFGAVVGLSLLAALMGAGGVMQFLWWPGGILATLAAIYTGFLFAQSKARDLWLSPALPMHLLVQAALAGAAALAILGLVVETTEQTKEFLGTVLLWSLIANLFIILVGELWLPHGTRDAAKAAQLILRGQFAQGFWIRVVLVGHVVPVAMLVANTVGGYEFVAAAAGVFALVGLLAFESIWVKAGQALPLS